MKQQNGKWHERYSVTPHPLGTMWTLWGINGIVSEPLGDYPREEEALEAMTRLKAEDEKGKSFPELWADEGVGGVWVVKAKGDGLWLSSGLNKPYAQLFAASPKLLAFAEAYLEAVEDAEEEGQEVEALSLMADRARAAVDEARGRV